MSFEGRLLKFAYYLRQAGLIVSQTEVQDCLQGLRRTNLDKTTFYHVLRSTMVKDQANFRLFDKAFNLFFNPTFQKSLDFSSDSERTDPVVQGLPSKRGDSAAGSIEPLITHDYGPNWGLGQSGGRASNSNLERMIQVIRYDDFEAFRCLAEEAIEQLGGMTGLDLCDKGETKRKMKVFLEWNMAINRLQREAEETHEIWLWQHRLQELERILEEKLEHELIKEFGEYALKRILLQENINTIEFDQLNDLQLKEIHKKITLLGHRLATRLSRRMSGSKEGLIDLSKTIRRAVNTGGIPIKTSFRGRIPARPEIWVLCDVSGSVKRFSEFMLQLLYSIQTRFLHVRSFVFIDSLAEASNCLVNRDIQEGMAEIFSTLKFSRTGFSDYGYVFRQLFEQYEVQLNRKITLLVIGDGKNNYRPEQTEYLDKVSQLVKRIIWLNPLPIDSWDSEDCVVNCYLPYCESIRECRNLAQLDLVARSIIMK